MDTEPLRRLEADQVERALAALRKDLPNSIHVTNTIVQGMRWTREKTIDVDFAVYRPVLEPDNSEGDVTALTIMRMKGVVPVITMHTTDRSCRLLRTALQTSQYIPWHEDMVVDNTHDGYVTDVMLEAVRAHGDLKPHTYPDVQLYLPKEEATKLDMRFVIFVHSFDSDVLNSH